MDKYILKRLEDDKYYTDGMMFSSFIGDVKIFPTKEDAEYTVKCFNKKSSPKQIYQIIEIAF